MTDEAALLASELIHDPRVLAVAPDGHGGVIVYLVPGTEPTTFAPQVLSTSAVPVKVEVAAGEIRAHSGGA